MAELKAMICGEDKTSEPEEPDPVEEESLDINQICSQINDHQVQFDPFVFIDNYMEAYSTDINAEALQNVLDKMNMAAGVDPIIMGKFDFWQYGERLISQIK